MARNPLEGSERQPLPGANAVAKADPGERLEVSVLLRRGNADVLKARVEKLANREGVGGHLSREAFDRQFGADSADIAAVKKFAAAHDLSVVQEHAGRRTVVLSGTVAQFNAAFGVDLQRFGYPGGSYRGRVGSVQLPDEPDPLPLANFLEAQKLRDPYGYPRLLTSIMKLLGQGEYVVDDPGQIPIPHFALALQDYAHTTAPNRRFCDLTIQRLLKALPTKQAPYSVSELQEIAAHCTEREGAARKVERLVEKMASAQILCPRVGQIFSGFITGASPKGTYVKLVAVPGVEGKIIRRAAGADVGDEVQVKLVHVDIEQGFIDFERQ